MRSTMGMSPPLLGVFNHCQPTIAKAAQPGSYLHYFPCCNSRSYAASSNCVQLGVTLGSRNSCSRSFRDNVRCKTTLFRYGLATGEVRGAIAQARIAVAAVVEDSNVGDNGEGDGSIDVSPAAALRRVLASPGVHQGPACYDALSARLVEQAGFSYAFMSGFAVSAVRLGAPDVGLLSYGEVLEQGRLITDAVSIPVIGDGDNGYGNALNVKRTVKGFMRAGFAGILIEDQVSPKSCGHFGGKNVVSRDEALTRIKAAIDARNELPGDIVIIARSDARQAESLEEALWRAENFALLGADVVFIDALASKDEMLAFCKVAPDTPKMANMLEGGGRTPILNPMELEELGFKLVAYPLSLVGVSIRAMQDALQALKSGRLPPPGDLPSFDEIKSVIGISNYYEEDEHYGSLQLSSASSSVTQAPPTDSKGVDVEGNVTMVEGNDSGNFELTPGGLEDSSLVYPDILDGNNTSSTSSSLSAIWSRVLRVLITGSNGDVKLDVRIPAGFLEGLSSTIPGFAGVNLPTLLDDALCKLRGNLQSGQQLFDYRDQRGDRIQVFLE